MDGPVGDAELHLNVEGTLPLLLDRLGDLEVVFPSVKGENDGRGGVEVEVGKSFGEEGARSLGVVGRRPLGRRWVPLVMWVMICSLSMTSGLTIGSTGWELRLLKPFLKEIWKGSASGLTLRVGLKFTPLEGDTVFSKLSSKPFVISMALAIGLTLSASGPA